MSTSPNPANIQILRIPSTSLAQYPRIDALVALINSAFITSWNTIDGLVGPEATRYESSDQFADEMGRSGVTWVAFDGSQEEGRIVATAGYKGWGGKWRVMERMERAEGLEVSHRENKTLDVDGAEGTRFEVVAVAVDPSLQKCGLASRVCGEVEAELKEKVRAMGEKRLILMVRTGKENNELYWTRRGYRILNETKFPPGNFGSKTGFSVLSMERVVEL